MASLVAKNYSEALFELAQEENKLDLIKEQLIQIDEVIKTYKELRDILKHPQIEKSEKKEMLLKIFDGMDHDVSSFVRLLIDKNRFSCFSEIVNEFTKKYNITNNIDVAYVYSAQALNEDELSRLKTMLEKKTNKSVEIKQTIDEDLIAGIKVKINDEVLDNTIATKLLKMKEAVQKTAL